MDRLCRASGTLMLICALTLTACRGADPGPPPIKAADLRRAEMIDLATLWQPHLTERCMGRSKVSGLAENVRRLTPTRRVMLTFGVGRLSRWLKPGTGHERVDATLEAELRHASTRIILDMPADRAGRGAPSIDGCRTSYLLSAPSYAGRFAFFDRDYRCDLCGSGATLVMKYDGKEWRLVAIHGNWVS